MTENTPSTNQEILERAIQKAIANGWLNNTNLEVKWNESDGYDRGYWFIYDDTDAYSLQDEEIIFSHDFAKALWGEEIHQLSYEDFPEEWQYHLQEMVIAPDPIAYLKENI